MSDQIISEFFGGDNAWDIAGKNEIRGLMSSENFFDTFSIDTYGEPMPVSIIVSDIDIVVNFGIDQQYTTYFINKKLEEAIIDISSR